MTETYRCPKCGNADDWLIRYVPERKKFLWWKAVEEHLSLRCFSCGYTFTTPIGSFRVHQKEGT